MHEYYVILPYDGAISLHISDSFCDEVTPGLFVVDDTPHGSGEIL